MIKVTYDSDVDAKYIYIKEGKFHETKAVNDWLYFDVNAENEVLGIEILDSTNNEVTLSTFEDNLLNITFTRNSGKAMPINELNSQNEYLESEKFVVAA